MARPIRVIVRRNRGGNGDQICSLVALRCARQLYPQPNYVVHAVGNPFYGLVYQTAITLEKSDECIGPPLWSDLGDAAFIEQFKLDTFDRVINLDGPEVEYAHRVNWNIQKSRQEIWCDEVLKGQNGQYPSDMVPRILINHKHRYALVSGPMQQAGLRPFEYVAVHWKSADPIKDYPHNVALITALRDRGHRVVVMHNDPVPDLSLPDKPVWTTSGMSAQNHAMILEMAQAVICPDSFILHLAAAVNCPTIGLFSSTNGAVTCKHYPYVTVVQNAQVGGKPCENTFPCYGLYGQNCWCLHRDSGMDWVPWCLEQVSHTSIVAMLERKIEENAEYNRARKEKIVNELDAVGMVHIDKVRFNQVMKKQRTLVVGVPPGIGDSLWAMLPVQAIMREDGSDGLIVCLQAGIPARGKEFIERLDFVTQARYEELPTYERGEFHILPDGTYNYACGTNGAVRGYMGMDWLLWPNRVLERGEHLRTWLAEFEHDWRVMDHFRFDLADDIVADQVSERLRGKPWVTFFLAGLEANGGLDGDGRYHEHGGYNRARRYTRGDWDRLRYLPELYRPDLDVRPLWLIDHWVETAKLLVTEQDCGIVIVGADWREDKEYAGIFVRAWEAAGYDPGRVVNLCGQTHIAECLRVIQRGRGLISYPSGVPIASTYLGVPTVMFYRAYGDPQNEANGRGASFSEDMATAWHPPGARYSPEFFGRCSPQSVQQTLGRLLESHRIKP